MLCSSALRMVSTHQDRVSVCTDSAKAHQHASEASGNFLAGLFVFIMLPTFTP